MSKHVVIAWTHYAFILDMSSWMLYCILGNTTMDACSFCSKFCTYKLCLISKYTVVNCEIYVTNTTAYLSLTSNNAFIYQAIHTRGAEVLCCYLCECPDISLLLPRRRFTCWTPGLSFPSLRVRELGNRHSFSVPEGVTLINLWTLGLILTAKSTYTSPENRPAR